MHSVLRLIPVAAIAAVASLSTPTWAVSPDAGYVQLQLAKLLFTDGRYIEAFTAFEQVKGHDDARINREALTGSVRTALRLGDFWIPQRGIFAIGRAFFLDGRTGRG